MLRHCRISLCKLLRNDHPRSLSIRSLSIRPLWIRSLCIRSLSIQTLRLRALCIRTLRIRPLCIRTLCIRSLRPHHKLTATVRTKSGAPWNLCPAFAAILHLICHRLRPPFIDPLTASARSGRSLRRSSSIFQARTPFSRPLKYRKRQNRSSRRSPRPSPCRSPHRKTR